MEQSIIIVQERVTQLLQDFRTAQVGAITSALQMAAVVSAVDNEVPQVKDEFYKKLGIDGISESTISKLRSIGATDTLYSNPKVLPLDREILYELRHIDQETFDGGVASGVIKPEMKRGDWKNRNKEVVDDNAPPEDAAVPATRRFLKLVEDLGIHQILESTKFRPEEPLEIRSSLLDIAVELESDDD